jgi:hypothetical protein
MFIEEINQLIYLLIGLNKTWARLDKTLGWKNNS